LFDIHLDFSDMLHIWYQKSPANARGTRDSDACVKARCKQNLSSDRCFI